MTYKYKRNNIIIWLAERSIGILLKIQVILSALFFFIKGGMPS